MREDSIFSTNGQIRATKKTWHCLQNTRHVLVSFIYNIIYLQAVSDPRLYEACYVHTNWSKGSDMESQKKLLLLNTSYLPMAFYWTYESPDERVSSLLYSANREKSSGIVQNKTKRVTKDSSDLSFLFCFYPDPLVSWEHSCRNQRGGQFAISFWWTIKKAHQFSIPNSNASTVNKSVW